MTDARRRRQKLLDAVLPSVDRLLDAAAQHDLGSAVVRRALEDAERDLLGLFDSLGADELSISTDGANVFINGSATRHDEPNGALSDHLDRLDLDRLSLSKHLGAKDLYDLLSFLAKTRGASSEEIAARSYIEISPNISLDFIGASSLATPAALSTTERIASRYAASHTALELIYKELSEGSQHAIEPLTHVARLIVDSTQQEPCSLLCALSPIQGDTERERISLHTAIITAVMMRTLDASARELLDAVSCALLLEAATSRALSHRAAADPFDLRYQLDADTLEAHEVIEAGVALIASLTRPMSITQAHLMYEVLQRSHSPHKPYQGKSQPGMTGILLTTAYRFVKETIADAPTESGSLDRAISTLAKNRRSRAEGLSLKLLCSCLGIFPVGTMTQLTSGWCGVVLRNHDHPALYERPLVVLTNAPDGRSLERVIDLSQMNQTSARLGMTHHALHEPSSHMQRVRERVMAGAFDGPYARPDYLNTPTETHRSPGRRSQTKNHKNSRLDALIQGSVHARKTPPSKRDSSKLFE